LILLWRFVRTDVDRCQENQKPKSYGSYHKAPIEMGARWNASSQPGAFAQT
jgi:hypothetical protein